MMYKKISLLSAVCALISMQAQAETLQYIPYAGVDYAYSKVKAQDTKPEYNALGINIGTKYNSYFGTELFYQQSFVNSKKNVHTSYRAYGLDIAGYLPFDCLKFSLIGTAGIGEYVFRQKETGDKRRNNSGWGYRIGGGLIYDLTDNLSLRMLVRYNGLDKISIADNMVEYTAGLRYHFNKD